MRRVFLFFVTLALLLGAVYYIFFLKNPKTSEKEVIIGIPQGTTVASLTDTLAAHQLIRSTLHFSLLLVRLARRRIFTPAGIASRKGFLTPKSFAD